MLLSRLLSRRNAVFVFVFLSFYLFGAMMAFFSLSSEQFLSSTLIQDRGREVMRSVVEYVTFEMPDVDVSSMSEEQKEEMDDDEVFGGEKDDGVGEPEVDSSLPPPVVSVEGYVSASASPGDVNTVGLPEEDLEQADEAHEFLASFPPVYGTFPSCEAIEKKLSVEVTLVTMMSEDRMWTLGEYCDRWKGEISAVIYSSKSKSELLDEVHTFHKGSCKDVALNLSVRVPTDEELSRPELFPINELRNIAIAAVKTSHYLYVDIDFWPSSDLYQLIHHKDVRNRLKSDHLQLLVVPAFERLTEGECDVDKDDCTAYYTASMPTTRRNLDSLIKNKKVHVFERFMSKAHGSTDANAWLRQRPGILRDINCIKSNRYEPYVVVRKCVDLPPFQEEFTGYGKNKIQHIIHLRHLGYKFTVLGGGFITHFPHPKSDARLNWGEMKNKKKKKKTKSKKKKDDPEGDEVPDYHRARMDAMYAAFKAWLREHGPVSSGGTRLCVGVNDDDALTHT